MSTAFKHSGDGSLIMTMECFSATLWEATLVLIALPLCLQVVGILHTINIVVTLVWPAWFIYEAQAGEWSSKKHRLRSFSSNMVPDDVTDQLRIQKSKSEGSKDRGRLIGCMEALTKEMISTYTVFATRQEKCFSSFQRSQLEQLWCFPSQSAEITLSQSLL